MRSLESFGVGRLAFSSASFTKRSAASPVNTGIDLIIVAIFCCLMSQPFFINGIQLQIYCFSFKLHNEWLKNTLFNVFSGRITLFAPISRWIQKEIRTFATDYQRIIK